MIKKKGGGGEKRKKGVGENIRMITDIGYMRGKVCVYVCVVC